MGFFFFVTLVHAIDTSKRLSRLQQQGQANRQAKERTNKQTNKQTPGQRGYTPRVKYDPVKLPGMLLDISNAVLYIPKLNSAHMPFKNGSRMTADSGTKAAQIWSRSDTALPIPSGCATVLLYCQMCIIRLLDTLLYIPETQEHRNIF